MFCEPSTISLVRAGEFGQLLRFAGGLAKCFRSNASLFEVLERLQQCAAKATGFADRREIAGGGDFIPGNSIAQQFQPEPWGKSSRRQEVDQCAEAQIGMAVG